MTRQPAVARRAEALLGSAVVSTSPVAGGDTATAVKLRLSSGRTALMKTLAGAPPGFFAAEAAGLRWLGGADGGVGTPEVLAVDDECLIVAWIEPGRSGIEAAHDLGRRLAATHAAGSPGFGAARPGFIGRLPLDNTPCDTWAEFYADRRVLPYLRVACDRGHVDPDAAAAIEQVAGRLAELVPAEGPSRLHGDLWNGNVIWGHDGAAYLIDPAAHGGHRETDLAMLALFGLPHLPAVLDAYTEAAPLAEDWEARTPLHQLHPLLVHACLFGGGYGARAGAIAASFA